MELSKRQEKIIEIIKKHGPITGESIAEHFSLSKATMRPDFALLTRAGIIASKPKVGYYFDEEITHHHSVSMQRPTHIHTNQHKSHEELTSLKVAEWMSVPNVILNTISVYDAIVELFMQDVGSLFITDDKGRLQGLISRKDLLRAAIGQADLQAVPIHMIMTRMPNIVTVSQGDSLLHASKKMESHKIDSLPVVETAHIDDKACFRVVGRVTKSTIVKAFVKVYG